MTSEPRATLLSIARVVGATLSGHGFSRRGLTLLKRAGDSTALVNFQSSTSSSRERLKFTVNVGIKFARLLSEREQNSTSVWDSHLRWRLGELMPQRNDAWWETVPGDNMIALGNDMALLIEETALPIINRYLDPRAAVALWESGQSPGLTEVQRVRFLERLKDRQNSL